MNTVRGTTVFTAHAAKHVGHKTSSCYI